MSDATTAWEVCYLTINIGGDPDAGTGGYVRPMQDVVPFQNLQQAWQTLNRLGVEGGEPFAVTHPKEGWDCWYLRRHLSTMRDGGDESVSNVGVDDGQ